MATDAGPRDSGVNVLGFSAPADSLNSTNLSACDLLNLTFIPQPIYSNVTAIFFKVCNYSAFASLVQDWGSFSFSADYESSNGTYTNVYLGVTWVAACGTAYSTTSTNCVHDEYWDGSLKNDTISGPFVSIYPWTNSPTPPSGLVSLVDLELIAALASVAIAITVIVAVTRKNGRKPPNGPLRN